MFQASNLDATADSTSHELENQKEPKVDSVFPNSSMTSDVRSPSSYEIGPEKLEEEWNPLQIVEQLISKTQAGISDVGESSTHEGRAIIDSSDLLQLLKQRLEDEQLALLDKNGSIENEGNDLMHDNIEVEDLVHTVKEPRVKNEDQEDVIKILQRKIDILGDQLSEEKTKGATKRAKTMNQRKNLLNSEELPHFDLQELNEAEAENKELNCENLALKLDSAKKVTKLESLEHSPVLERQLQAARIEKSDLTEEKNELTDQIEAQTDLIKNLERKNDILENQLAIKTQKEEQKRSQTRELRKSFINTDELSKFDMLEQELNEAEAENKELNCENLALKFDIAEKVTKFESLEQKFVEQLEKLTVLETENKLLKSRLEDVGDLEGSSYPSEIDKIVGGVENSYLPMSIESTEGEQKLAQSEIIVQQFAPDSLPLDCASDAVKEANQKSEEDVCMGDSITDLECKPFEASTSAPVLERKLQAARIEKSDLTEEKNELTDQIEAQTDLIKNLERKNDILEKQLAIKTQKEEQKRSQKRELRKSFLNTDELPKFDMLEQELNEAEAENKELNCENLALNFDIAEKVTKFENLEQKFVDQLEKLTVLETENKLLKSRLEDVGDLEGSSYPSEMDKIVGCVENSYLPMSIESTEGEQKLTQPEVSTQKFAPDSLALDCASDAVMEANPKSKEDVCMDDSVTDVECKPFQESTSPVAVLERRLQAASIEICDVTEEKNELTDQIEAQMDLIKNLERKNDILENQLAIKTQKEEQKRSQTRELRKSFLNTDDLSKFDMIEQELNEADAENRDLSCENLALKLDNAEQVTKFESLEQKLVDQKERLTVLEKENELLKNRTEGVTELQGSLYSNELDKRGGSIESSNPPMSIESVECYQKIAQPEIKVQQFAPVSIPLDASAAVKEADPKSEKDVCMDDSVTDVECKPFEESSSPLLFPYRKIQASKIKKSDHAEEKSKLSDQLEAQTDLIKNLKRKNDILENQLANKALKEEQKRSQTRELRKSFSNTDELPKFDMLEQELNEAEAENKELSCENLALKFDNSEKVTKFESLEQKYVDQKERLSVLEKENKLLKNRTEGVIELQGSLYSNEQDKRGGSIESSYPPMSIESIECYQKIAQPEINVQQFAPVSIPLDASAAVKEADPKSEKDVCMDDSVTDVECKPFEESSSLLLVPYRTLQASKIKKSDHVEEKNNLSDQPEAQTDLIKNLKRKNDILENQLANKALKEEQKRSQKRELRKSFFNTDELPKFDMLEQELNEAEAENKELNCKNLALKFDIAEKVTKVESLEQKLVGQLKKLTVLETENKLLKSRLEDGGDLEGSSYPSEMEKIVGGVENSYLPMSIEWTEGEQKLTQPEVSTQNFAPDSLPLGCASDAVNEANPKSKGNVCMDYSVTDVECKPFQEMTSPVAVLEWKLQAARIEISDVTEEKNELTDQIEAQTDLIKNLERKNDILENQLAIKTQKEEQKRSRTRELRKSFLNTDQLPTFDMLEQELNEAEAENKELNCENSALKFDNAEKITKFESLEQKYVDQKERFAVLQKENELLKNRTEGVTELQGSLYSNELDKKGGSIESSYPPMSIESVECYQKIAQPEIKVKQFAPVSIPLDASAAVKEADPKSEKDACMDDSVTDVDCKPFEERSSPLLVPYRKIQASTIEKNDHAGEKNKLSDQLEAQTDLIKNLKRKNDILENQLANKALKEEQKRSQTRELRKSFSNTDELPKFHMLEQELNEAEAENKELSCENLALKFDNAEKVTKFESLEQKYVDQMERLTVLEKENKLLKNRLDDVAEHEGSPCPSGLDKKVGGVEKRYLRLSIESTQPEVNVQQFAPDSLPSDASAAVKEANPRSEEDVCMGDSVTDLECKPFQASTSAPVLEKNLQAARIENSDLTEEKNDLTDQIEAQMDLIKNLERKNDILENQLAINTQKEEQKRSHTRELRKSFFNTDDLSKFDMIEQELNEADAENRDLSCENLALKLDNAEQVTKFESLEQKLVDQKERLTVLEKENELLKNRTEGVTELQGSLYSNELDKRGGSIESSNPPMSIESVECYQKIAQPEIKVQQFAPVSIPLDASAAVKEADPKSEKDVCMDDSVTDVECKPFEESSSPLLFPYRTLQASKIKKSDHAEEKNNLSDQLEAQTDLIKYLERKTDILENQLANKTQKEEQRRSEARELRKDLLKTDELPMFDMLVQELNEVEVENKVLNCESLALQLDNAEKTTKLESLEQMNRDQKEKLQFLELKIVDQNEKLDLLEAEKQLLTDRLDGLLGKEVRRSPKEPSERLISPENDSQLAAVTSAGSDQIAVQPAEIVRHQSVGPLLLDVPTVEMNKVDQVSEEYVGSARLGMLENLKKKPSDSLESAYHQHQVDRIEILQKKLQEARNEINELVEDRNNLNAQNQSQVDVIKCLEKKTETLYDHIAENEQNEERRRVKLIEQRKNLLSEENTPGLKFMELELNEANIVKKQLSSDLLVLKIENVERIASMNNLEKKCEEQETEIDELKRDERVLQNQLSRFIMNQQQEAEPKLASRQLIEQLKSDSSSEFPTQESNEKDEVIGQLANQIADLKSELKQLEKLNSDRSIDPITEDIISPEILKKVEAKSFISKEVYINLQDDLEKTTDKLLECEINLETLEKQLDEEKIDNLKLNQVKHSLQNQLKDSLNKSNLSAESSDTIEEIIGLKSHLSELEAECGFAKVQNEELNQHIEQKDSQLSVLKNTNQQLKQEVSKLMSHRMQNLTEAPGLEPQAYAELVCKNCELESENGVLKQKITKLSQIEEQLKEKAQILEEETKILAEEVKAVAKTEKSGEIENFVETKAALKEELSHLKAENVVLSQNELKVLNQNRNLAQQKQILEKQCEKLEDECNKLSRSSALNSSSSYIPQIDKTIDRKASILKLEAENEVLTNQIDGLQSEAEEKSQLVDKLANQNEALKRELKIMNEQELNVEITPENVDIVQNLIEVKTKLKETKIENESLTKQVENTKKIAEKENFECQKFKGFNHKLSEEIQKLVESQTNEGSSSTKALAQEISSLKVENMELSAEIRSLNDHFQDTKNNETVLKNEIEFLEMEKEKLESIIDANFENGDQIIDELHQSNQGEAELFMVQKELEDLKDKLADEKKNNLEHSGKIDMLERYSAKLSEELQKSASKTGQIFDEQSNQIDPSENTDAELKLKVVVDQLNEKLSEAIDANALLMEDIHQLAHEKQILEDLQTMNLADISEPERELVTAKQELGFANVALENLEKKFEKSKKSELEAKKALEVLKLVEDKFEPDEVRKISSGIIEGSQIIDNQELKAEAFELRLRNRELEDENLYLKSSKHRLEGELESSLKRDPSELSQNLLKAKSDAKALSIERDSLRQQLGALMSDDKTIPSFSSSSAPGNALGGPKIEDIEGDQSSLNDKIEQLQNEMKSSRTIKASLNDQLNAIADQPSLTTDNGPQDLSNLTDFVQVLRTKDDTMKVLLDQIENEIGSQKEKTQELVKDNAELAQENENLRSQVLSIGGQVEPSESKFDPENEVSKLHKSFADTHDQIAHLESENARLSREKKNLLNRIESLSRKNEELHVKNLQIPQNLENSENQQKLTEQFSLIKDKEAENSALISQVKELTASEQQSREKIKSLEIDKAKLESKVGPLKKGAALKKMDPLERIRELEAVEKLLKKRHNETEKLYDAELVKTQQLNLQNAQYQERQKSLLESEKQLVSKMGEIEKLESALQKSEASVSFLRENIVDLEEKAAAANEQTVDTCDKVTNTDTVLNPELDANFEDLEKIEYLTAENDQLKAENGHLKEQLKMSERQRETALTGQKPSDDNFESPQTPETRSDLIDEDPMIASGRGPQNLEEIPIIDGSLNRNQLESQPDFKPETRALLSKRSPPKPSGLPIPSSSSSMKKPAGTDEGSKRSKSNLDLLLESKIDRLKSKADSKIPQSKAVAKNKPEKSLQLNSETKQPQNEKLEAVPILEELPMVAEIQSNDNLKSGLDFFLADSSPTIPKVGTHNLQSQIKQLKDSLDKLKNDHESLKSDSSEMKQQLIDDIVKTQNRIENSFEKVLEETELEMKEKDYKIDSLNEDLDLTTEAYNEISNDFENLQNENENLRELVIAAENDKIGSENWNEEKIIFQATVDNLQNQIEDKDFQMEELLTHSEENEQLITELSKNSENMENQIQEQLMEIEKADLEREEFVKKIDSLSLEQEILLSKLKDAENEVEKSRQNSLNSTQKIEDTENEIINQKSEIEKSNLERQKMNRKIRELENEVAEKSSELKNAENDLENVKIDLIDLKRDNKKLALKLNDSENTNERSKEIEENLESEVLRLKNELNLVLDDLGLVKEESKRLFEAQNRNLKEFENLQDENAEKTILIENLESEKQTLKSKNSKLQDEKRAFIKDLEQLQEDLRTEQQESADLKNNRDLLKDRIEDLKNSKIVKDKTIEIYEDEKHDLQEKVSNLESELASAQRNVKNLEHSKEKIMNELKQTKELLNELENSLNNSANESELTKSEQTRLTNQLKFCEKKIADLANQIQDANAHVAQLEEELELSRVAEKEARQMTSQAKLTAEREKADKEAIVDDLQHQVAQLEGQYYFEVCYYAEQILYLFAILAGYDLI